MQITNLTSLNFTANINSPKLKFKQVDFFVPIRGYGKNSLWAQKTKTTADKAVNMIRNNTSGENVLKFIASGIRCANRLTLDINKVKHSGILRYKKEGWLNKSSWFGCNLCTNYSNINRYKSYQERLDKVVLHPLKNPYSDIELTRAKICKDAHYLQHGSWKCVDYALNKVFDLYDVFKAAFDSKNIKECQMEDLNETIAEIRWIMAHATPWERGSDAISNVFMRAMYKSLGVKTFPLKAEISLDMEAYCTELADYKKNFSSYFQREPQIIE